MPYRIGKHPSCSKPYAVLRSSDGKMMGCYASRQSARAQISEWRIRDGMQRDKAVAESETEYFAEAMHVKSDERAEAIVEALVYADDLAAFPDDEKEAEDTGLLGHIKGLFVKNAIKRESGLDYPARDYAYVPDANTPSTWQLRLTESPGKITLAQLGRAAAALSSGGFRGARANIPAPAVSAVKRRIRAEYRRLGMREQQIPSSVKETTRFSVWKQADGQHRWLAIYSNKFRDDDGVPEIIAEESHELFVDLVDKGLVPYPELWHYHVPGTRWGIADWVGYSDGFALASGTVDAGHEKEAELLADREDIGVSHGMPGKWILRDEVDPTIIVAHITSEISPLPMTAAANKLTGFFIKESEEMALSDQKKQHLISVGLSLEDIAGLEGSLKDASDGALAAGLESKEAEAPKPVPTPDPAPTPDPVPDPDPVPVPAVVATVVAGEVKDANGEPILTRLEVAEAIKAMAEVFGGRINDLTASLNEVLVEVKSLKETDEVKVAKAAEATPAMSLTDLIGSLAGLNKEAQLDGRTRIAQSKPKEDMEKEKTNGTKNVTGVSFIDNLFVSKQAEPQD